MNRIRLGLCVCVLALGVVCLWLAQEQIALAADMLQQSGGEFDSSSLLRLDPAFALAGENMFAPDDQEQSLDSQQSLAESDPSLISDPMAADQSPDSSQVVPPAQPAPLTTDSTGSAAGWPKTTAETTLAAPSSNPASSGHWVDVNISKQQATAYDGSIPIKTVWTSTGTRRHPTVVGTFHVWIKLRSTTMSGGSYARRRSLSPDGRALCHVLLSRLCPAWNILASQLRTPDEPRLRQPHDRRFGVVLQLRFRRHARPHTLLMCILFPLAHGASGIFDELLLGAEGLLLFILIIAFFRSRGRRPPAPADPKPAEKNEQ